MKKGRPAHTLSRAGRARARRRGTCGRSSGRPRTIGLREQPRRQARARPRVRQVEVEGSTIAVKVAVDGDRASTCSRSTTTSRRSAPRALDRPVARRCCAEASRQPSRTSAAGELALIDPRPSIWRLALLRRASSSSSCPTRPSSPTSCSRPATGRCRSGSASGSPSACSPWSRCCRAGGVVPARRLVHVGRAADVPGRRDHPVPRGAAEPTRRRSTRRRSSPRRRRQHATGLTAAARRSSSCSRPSGATSPRSSPSTWSRSTDPLSVFLGSWVALLDGLAAWRSSPAGCCCAT